MEQVRTAASAWVEAQSRPSAARRGIYRDAAAKIDYYQARNREARIFHTRATVARLLAVGVLALLLSQLFINVGMAIGLMPITGMTLPLISYGGSSLVINCAALGMLVNVGQRRPISLGKRPFEYGEKKEKPPAPYGPLADGGWQGSPARAAGRDNENG